MNRFYIFIVILTLAGIKACAFPKIETAFIDLEYSNIANASELKVFSKANEKIWTEIDSETLQFESNTYKLYLNGIEDVEYLLILGDSIRIDSITNIQIDRYKRFDSRIKSIQYNLNNETKTETTIYLD